MLHKVSGKNRGEVCATFLLTKLGGMWYNENSGARERAPAAQTPISPPYWESPWKKEVFKLKF
jgi:hypothetical protein